MFAQRYFPQVQDSGPPVGGGGEVDLVGTTNLTDLVL